MEMQVHGTTVHYERCGTGKKRVVLLHGWGCSTELMQPVADQLSDQLDVLLIDFPAHGKSGRPPEPWGVPEYAACTLEVLRRLDFLPCAVIAHSFGARVTIQLAADDPSLFTKLILTGAAGVKKPATAESSKRTQQYKKLKRLCEAAKGMKIFGSLPEKAEDALRRKYGSADYNALDEEMRKTFVKVISLDLTDRLKDVKQPTLLVFGDQDTETPLWMAKVMEENIPDAGLVTLAGGTHFAYLEQAGRFCAIAQHFLTEGDR